MRPPLTVRGSIRVSVSASLKFIACAGMMSLPVKVKASGYQLQIAFLHSAIAGAL